MLDRALLWGLAVLIAVSLAALSVQITIYATVGSVGGSFASAIVSRVKWGWSQHAPAFFALAGIGLTAALAILALRAEHLESWMRIGYGAVAVIVLVAEVHFAFEWRRYGSQARVRRADRRSS